MEIPFIGGAYQGRSSNLNAQVCQNLFPVIDNQDGSSVLSLMGTPGLKLWCDCGIVGEVRGLYEWKGFLYAAIGSTLWKISNLGTAANVGTIGTVSGKVWMAGGTRHLMLIDGMAGYYREEEDTSLTTIADPDFPTASSIAYQDGYFIVTEAGTDSFFISASEDASSWDGLDFASAEDSPDDVLAVVRNNRELWMFGQDTMEIYYNSGDTDFPFTRLSGGVIQVGCGAPASLISSYEGLFGLDNKYRVRMVSSGQAEVISTPQIEYHISTYATKSDAIGFTYSLEGHSFYVLTFPSADRTWVYDVTTKYWHNWSSGLDGGRHRSNCSAFFTGKQLVGDYSNGKIYELDLATYTDNGGSIRRVRAVQTTKSSLNRVFHSRLQVEFEGGTGLETGDGSDPQAMLDWSDDGGHTWSNEHWAGIGKIGEYKNRAVWRRLGSSRLRNYRLTITDPVKVVIIGAQLDAGAGAS